LAELRGEDAGAIATGRALVQRGTVSPRRSVPATIPAPDYAKTGRPRGEKSGDVSKDAAQIAQMRASCAAARDVLETVKRAVRVGVTTDELDAIAHQRCIDLGGYPSTLNYFGYGKSICTSINEVICHGIPDSRELQDGDIVNVDVSIFIGGTHGDCSETLLVGEVDEEGRHLVATTRECLLLGIGAVRPGGHVRDIGKAIQTHAEKQGFSVVRAFVGHGIGEQFHMEPQVPHYHDATATFELQPGMTFTIEPMINVGDWRHVVWDDNWTAVTADQKRSAQFEHTVLVTEQGVEVLTLPPGEPQPYPH